LPKSLDIQSHEQVVYFAKMPSAQRPARTLYDKVFQSHIVDEKLDGTILLYIDRHLVHEVTSPVSSLLERAEFVYISDVWYLASL
jgi:hypothetical protein